MFGYNFYKSSFLTIFGISEIIFRKIWGNYKTSQLSGWFFCCRWAYFPLAK